MRFGSSFFLKSRKEEGTEEMEVVLDIKKDVRLLGKTCTWFFRKTYIFFLKHRRVF